MGADKPAEELFWIPWCIDGEKYPGIYHSDWRNYLNEKNQNEIRYLMRTKSHAHRFLYSRNIAEFFLASVQAFELPPEVFYLALDTFDKFWVEALCEKRKECWWKKTEANDELARETCLISLSCIQIASKICCSCKMVPTVFITEFAGNFGINVTKKEVMKYEMTVYRAVGWMMSNVSVLSYIEMFLEDMTHLLVNVKRSELLEVCVRFANVATVFHCEIYTKLHIAFKKRPLQTIEERRFFLTVEGDLVRRASSIICASAMFFDPSNLLAEDMLAYLVKTTSYQAVEIKVLSQIMSHITLRNKETTLWNQRTNS